MDRATEREKDEGMDDRERNREKRNIQSEEEIGKAFIDCDKGE